MKIYIPQDIDGAGKRYLTERGYELKIGSSADEEIMVEEIGDCDGIIMRTARLSSRVMEAAPRLKVIAKHGVGTDNIDVEAASRLGIRVTNGPLSNSESVAEHTVAFILALAHQLFPLDGCVRRGDWGARNSIHLTDLRGKTVGLVGFGRIGAAVARRLAFGFDMKILTFGTRHGADLPVYVKLASSMENLLAQSDFVSLHCPSTPETKGMVDRQFLEHMKESAFLINTARGDIVKEQDLYEALVSGTIAGAALDVLAEEPVRPGNPLCGLPGLILTPHCAAHTDESFANMSLHAAIGVDEVLGKRSVTWPVNEPESL